MGSCEGNAIANAYELQVRRLYPDKFVDLSRLFIYYNSRLLNNTVSEDAGAFLEDGMKAIKKFGICSEELWPYDIKKFDSKPSEECYSNAQSRNITNYHSLTSIEDIINAVNDNKPVVIGVSVYDSFYDISKNDSVIHSPSDYELESRGFHAMAVVGYDLTKQQLLVKNSFGSDWGDQGYAWLPFEYLKKQWFEAWVFDISNQQSQS